MAQPVQCDRGDGKPASVLQTDLASGAVTALCADHLGTPAPVGVAPEEAPYCDADDGAMAVCYMKSFADGEDLNFCGDCMALWAMTVIKSYAETNPDFLANMPADLREATGVIVAEGEGHENNGGPKSGEDADATAPEVPEEESPPTG